MADSGLTVGIQHPGLPIGMVMSCDQNEFYVHVLDVNANCLYRFMFKYSNYLPVVPHKAVAEVSN